MDIILENSANTSMDNIFYYNLKYSSYYAVETDKIIKSYINDLLDFPYMGRCIPELTDKRFREIIYIQDRSSVYRIMYFISNKTNTIYVFYVINSKQNFNQILKQNNYFTHYFKF